jgi:succinoglycan biosynthesis protein ExoA
LLVNLLNFRGSFGRRVAKLDSAFAAAPLARLPADLAAPPLVLSVVVPVRNEHAYIRQTLQMLLHQQYPRDAFEVLVVDGESTDGTGEVVEQFAKAGAPVRLLPNPRRWSSAARNVGVRAARGDVVVVIDGHCQLPDRGHLQAVAEAFQRSGADVLGRPQPLTVDSSTPLQRAIAAARASRLGHHPDSYIYTSRDQFVPAQSVGAAYRRSVFARIGYFDERFDACEDVDFNYRADQAGLRCFLAARAAVHYYPRESLTGLFQQLARYGRGRVRLGRKHPGTLGWKSLAPAALVLLLMAGTVAAPFSTWARIGLATLVVVYLSVILLVSGYLAGRQRLGRAAGWLPLVFATIHVAAGVGVLHEWLCGRRDMKVTPHA